MSKITYLSLHRALNIAFDQEIFTAIKYKKTENHTAGQQIKFTGSGGSMAAGTAPLAGGGGAQTLSLTAGGSTTAIGVGDPIAYTSGASATLSSTFASQEYAISRTNSMGQGIGTVGEVSNGNLPLSLGSVNFAAWNSTTYNYPSATFGQSIYVYRVITNSTFYTLNVQAASPEGGGGGFPGGGGVGGVGGGGVGGVGGGGFGFG